MKKFYFFLFSANLIGQSLVLPYDWSGQFGTMTVKGALFWNKDWLSGPLLFDGTYAFYPVRYGNRIFSQFNPISISEIDIPNQHFVDSTQTTTTLNYFWGDYNYDQLGINLNIQNPKRYSGFNIFKSSYAGRAGQFFHPTGSSWPLQQSYVIDYGSENNGWLTVASAGRFVTESGLPDSGAINGQMDDEILTSGLIIRSPDDGIQWTSHAALFHQWRDVDVSWYANGQKQFVSRARLHQQISGFSIGRIEPVFGLALNSQYVAKNDSISIQRTWSTIYNSAELFGLLLSTGGLTFYERKTYPYFSFSLFHRWGLLYLGSGIEQKTTPAHIDVMIQENDHMENRDIFFNMGYGKEGTEISLIGNKSSLTFNEKLYGSSQAGLEYSFSFLKNFLIKGHYFKQEGNSFLFNGIGTSILFHIGYKNHYKRFDLDLNISANGLLDRSNKNQFHAVIGYPYEVYLFTDNIEDIWLLNAWASTTIKTMTIIWSIKNILHAIEPTALDIFPDKEEGDFLIRHNNQFPPMGRIVSIGIVWDFDN